MIQNLLQVGILFTLSLSTITSAQTDKIIHSNPKESVPRWSGYFIEPNEHNVQDASPVFEKVGSGVLISTGTERAFAAFSLTPAEKVTHLWFVDLDPLAIRYNLINSALIAVASSSKEVRSLRDKASHDTWRELAKKHLQDKPLLDETLSSTKNYEWWKTKVRPHLGKVTQFKIDKYLDSAFSRLKDTILSERVAFFEVNMTSEAGLETIAGELQKASQKIAAIDISNTLTDMGEKIEPAHVEHVTRILEPHTSPETLLITTRIIEAAYEEGQNKLIWAYGAFPMQTLAVIESGKDIHQWFDAAFFSAKEKSQLSFVSTEFPEHCVSLRDALGVKKSTKTGK